MKIENIKWRKNCGVFCFTYGGLKAQLEEELPGYWHASVEMPNELVVALPSGFKTKKQAAHWAECVILAYAAGLAAVREKEGKL